MKVKVRKIHVEGFERKGYEAYWGTYSGFVRPRATCVCGKEAAICKSGRLHQHGDHRDLTGTSMCPELKVKA